MFKYALAAIVCLIFSAVTGVFAVGDATNKGADIAIAAIGEAGRAADVIDAYLNGVSVVEGQKVSIVGRMSSGMHAVVIAFVVPLAIMIALIAVLMYIGSSEITAAAAALGGLVFYYVMLIPFRKKLNRKFSFTIKPY